MVCLMAWTRVRKHPWVLVWTNGGVRSTPMGTGWPTTQINVPERRPAPKWTRTAVRRMRTATASSMVSTAAPNTPSDAEVDAAGCPVVVEPEPEPEPELIFGNVHFAHDSAELDAAASSILDGSGNALSDRPNERVRVVGHADSTGPEDYNLALSLRRAQAVRDYLAGNFPALDADRFQIAGAGESQPVADNTTKDGRRQNRRVEILPAGTR